MGFPRGVVDSVMVKGGRRCAVCRRFEPMYLQVHHIIEQSQGGGNEEDNAVPLCVTCHQGVHARVPFARTFTPEELKGHRENLYEAVASGRLPREEEQASTLELALGELQEPPEEEGISPEACHILIEAARAEDHVMLMPTLSHIHLQAGSIQESIPSRAGRREAEVRSAIRELENSLFIELTGFATDSGGIWRVTLEGYEAADRLIAYALTETEKS